MKNRHAVDDVECVPGEYTNVSWTSEKMDNLNFPPTKFEVVAQTMRISEKLAAGCGEPHALDHYELVVLVRYGSMRQSSTKTRTSNTS